MVNSSFWSSTLKMWIYLSHKHAKTAEKLYGNTIYLIVDEIDVIKQVCYDIKALSPSKVWRVPYFVNAYIFSVELVRT